MAYKNIQQHLSFADIAVQKYADKNRSLLFLRQINETIDWMPVQELLLKHYTIGKAETGEKAYPPLLLLNACFFRNGSGSSPILNLKARSMTASRLNRFSNFPWISLLRIIPLFHASGRVFPKRQ